MHGTSWQKLVTTEIPTSKRQATNVNRFLDGIIYITRGGKCRKYMKIQNDMLQVQSARKTQEYESVANDKLRTTILVERFGLCVTNWSDEEYQRAPYTRDNKFQPLFEFQKNKFKAWRVFVVFRMGGHRLVRGVFYWPMELVIAYHSISGFWGYFEKQAYCNGNWIDHTLRITGR